ncbi:unnamed protein product [Rotaria magnacalcarata]|uniref:Peptidoglycan-recognition protein n=2 Tax=Rotaria magnacalcarata TaxID=392030 RepID=A0A816YWP2_9BILA|nr:unnamed protein product [Rotaria magnacalcarata]CAF2033873.1 unnamed protein product [Rotaria magnacalcarata]CAF2164977.1 unnamed protein product [Rotaria magnacalcarata]CAF3877976.1 unnamed protein product [Rotaria magnacalcarata]
MTSILFIYHLLLAIVSSQSPCDELSLVDRAEWGAQEPIKINNITSKPLSFIVMHHSYSPSSCYDDDSCIERVKDIQSFHQTSQGWDDIGFHFLVGENGKVYEGRGWNRQAAHSTGWNNGAYGVCIIGDFTNASPNEKALNAVRLWIDCGIKLGYVKEDHYIITHRQSQRPHYTDCPGDNMFGIVRSWPRYCSFQNSGASLNANKPQIALALEFCEKQLSPLSSASTNLATSLIMFYLLLIHSL